MEKYKLEKVSRLLSSKTSIVLAIVLILLLIIIITISIYVGLSLTKPKRETIKDTPKNYGLIYEDVSFKCIYDKTKLNGWWIPAQESKHILKSNNTIVFAHGYGSNRAIYSISGINLAKRLAREGYNVFTFDFRASGESEGDFSSIGQLEKYDLLSAINFVKYNKDSKDISLIGWSMGAATSILAGEESKDVNKVIADSPFHNLKEYLKRNLPYWSDLPDFPFTKVILGCLPIIKGLNINKVNPAEGAKKFGNKKLFLIHSKDDKAIPFTNSEIIYNSFRNKKNIKMWFTKKAGHIKSYVIYGKEYEDKIISFLNGK